MTRPRVPLGLEASRTTLDRTFAAELGERARAARVGRGLDIGTAARAVMLSPAQLTSLETAQPEAFYGAEFYANALRKYLQYLGLDAASAGHVLIQPGTPAVAPSPRPARTPSLAPTVVAAAVTASAIGGWFLLAPRRQAPAATSTSGQAEPDAQPAGQAGADVQPASEDRLPIASPEVVPPAEVPAAAPALALQTLSDTLSPVLQTSGLAESSPTAAPAARFGSVAVSGATWVFVRYADNTTDERHLGPRETFVLRAQPVYIAVGLADGTAISVNGQPIDSKPFVVNGQIRIGRAFLGTLLAGL